MIPKRIQRKRVKGWKMPENTVSVTRPGKYGNPHKVINAGTGRWVVVNPHREPQTIELPHRVAAIEESLALYKNYMRFGSDSPSPAELRGKNLACYCHLCEAHKDGRPLGVECRDCDPCHVDVLLPLANPELIERNNND